MSNVDWEIEELIKKVKELEATIVENDLYLTMHSPIAFEDKYIESIKDLNNAIGSLKNASNIFVETVRMSKRSIIRT